MATSTSNPQLDLIGIVVEDMARSLAFYRQLGLDVPTDADRQPHAEVTLPGGMRRPGTRSRRSGPSTQTSRHRRATPGIGLAFRLLNPAAVDATYERLFTAGAHSHKAPWDADWGQRYALLHDPDGNNVDLFASLPEAGDAT